MLREDFEELGYFDKWDQQKIDEQIEARLESVRPIVASKGSDDLTPAEFRKIKTLREYISELAAA